MRVVNVSTYLPTKCGLATFSNDLVNSMRFSPLVRETEIVSVTPDPDEKFGPPVIATIVKQKQRDYRRVARLVNKLQPDVVMIQHEFGIFGGAFGEYVLDFSRHLDVPYVVTLHTVLPEFQPGQAQIIKKLCEKAAAVLVFTPQAKKLILKASLVDEGKIYVVPHGAPPEITRIADEKPRSGAHKRNRFVISSFGLLAPRKGLELIIEAVGQIVPKYPQVQVVIAGQIHPEVLRKEGTTYQDSLLELVKKYGIEDHVSFEKKFLSIEDLAHLLEHTDLFVSAYRGREQIVSGALTFAIAAGCASVSTPYRYAEDMLTSGAGTLIPFGDSNALAEAITSYVKSPAKLERAQAEARRIGAELSWPAVGQETARILQHASNARADSVVPLTSVLSDESERVVVG